MFPSFTVSVLILDPDTLESRPKKRPGEYEEITDRVQDVETYVTHNTNGYT